MRVIGRNMDATFGLIGSVTAVYHHAAAVKLDNDPASLQRVVAPGGLTGAASPNPQRLYAFYELERIEE